MGAIENLLKKVQRVAAGLESGEIVRDVLSQYRDDIIELQQQQLFAGKASSGEDIRPYYSEDIKPNGYFNTKQSAERYAAWKEIGVTYPVSVHRNPDAPNLYINGRFHSELGVLFAPDSVAVVPTTNYATRIVAKYGMNSFGLMASNWAEIFRNRGALDDILNNIKTILYDE